MQQQQRAQMRSQAGLPVERSTAGGAVEPALGARVPRVRFSPTAAASVLGTGAVAITVALPEGGGLHRLWLWKGAWNEPPRLEQPAQVTRRTPRCGGSATPGAVRGTHARCATHAPHPEPRAKRSHTVRAPHPTTQPDGLVEM
eukprot:7006678-Prymnesium_polylepis.1